MTFLNGLLAFGAGALVIPLVIHLLNRSRFRTVEWGAMHLLESVVRANYRRLRLEQLLLLVVRCAIPAVLAFCLARPVLTGWQALPGDAPSSLVLLIDDSYSMDTLDGGQSRFRQAIDAAGQIVRHAPRGSDVAIVTMGGRPETVLDRPVFDPHRAIRALQSLPGGTGPCAAAEALDAAVAVLSQMTNARRQLVLLSDFQRSDWDAATSPTVERFREQIRQLPLRPAITFFPIGNKAENNVSIDSVEIPKTLIGIGQPVSIRVHLRNHSSQLQPAVRVALSIDGTRVDTTQVAIEGKATSQVLFTQTFPAPGSHVLSIDLANSDALPTDNHYRVALSVLDRIPVVLVDGAPSDEPLRSETDFLAVALAPYTFGRAKLADLIETRTVTAPQLSESVLAQASVVVLANVTRLDDDQVQRLQAFVSSGGGLMIFPGDRIDPNWYNQVLGDPGAGLLPLPFGILAGRTVDQGRATRIVAEHFDHPALQLFNQRVQGSLADAEIGTWYRLGSTVTGGSPAPAQASAAGSASLVAARFETSDPFLVQRQVGEGVVVQCATACDADWSNLPLQPCYLPLMQELVMAAASRIDPPRNLRPGQAAVANQPAEAEGHALALTRPDGMRQMVRARRRGPRCVVEYRATRRPGVYTLTGTDGRPIHFVVETERSESQPDLVTSGRLKKLAARFGAQIARTTAEYEKQERIRRHGREIWRWALWSVLGLMLLELVLQQRFARVKT